MKAIKCLSTDDWVKKMYIHIMEYYIAQERLKSIHSQQKGGNLRDFYAAKVSQNHKNKY